MTLKTRRFLYILFIAAFFITTPLVILYANGYKLSLNQKGLVKTGMFIFDTKPEGAKIYINDELQQDFFNKYLDNGDVITTPARIKNMLPGEYEVRIELDGYWPWQKKLSIHPGTSTYAEDVVLFKKNLPLLMLEGEINNVVLSPDKSHFLAQKADGLYLISNETETIEYKIDSEAGQLTWSADSRYFLVDSRIYGLDGPELIVDLTKETPQSTNFKWDDNDNISYQTPTGIFSYDLSGRTSKSLITKPELFDELFKDKIAVDHLLKDGYLFVVTDSKGSLVLNVVNLQSGEHLRKISLPNSSTINFINTDNQFLNLVDSKNKILYLIEPLAFYPVKETINNISNSNWIDNDRLLYSNDFEIFIFDVASGRKTLLTRLSTPINSALWHPSNNYIIFTNDRAINSLELDERDRRNTIELFNLEMPGPAVLNSEGNALYFVGKIGNQRGLYKLAIE